MPDIRDMLQVFGMNQPAITAEITNSQLKMVMEVERGTFIVPSFDEIWPQAGKQREKARKRMGMDYILEVNIYSIVSRKNSFKLR